jgi:hypothetical protein
VEEGEGGEEGEAIHLPLWWEMEEGSFGVETVCGVLEGGEGDGEGRREGKV